jgi:hypothetical protein
MDAAASAGLGSRQIATLACRNFVAVIFRNCVKPLSKAAKVLHMRSGLIAAPQQGSQLTIHEASMAGGF